MVEFKLLYPGICSCSRELGVLQYEFEKSGKKAIECLNERNITKMCCRRCILNAPCSIITNADIGTFRDEVGIGNQTLANPIILNAPPPIHDDFPLLPGTVVENRVIEDVLLPEAVIPKPFALKK